MFDKFLIIFTAAATFHIIAGFLAMFLLSLLYLSARHHRETGRRLLRILLKLAGGFLAGMATAWLIVVILHGWKLPVWETFYAGFHSEIYSHDVEHAAEAYSLFMFFVGDIFTIAAGIILWIFRKHRVRAAEVT